MPTLFLTGQGDIPSSVRAMRGGAEDFLEKTAPKEKLVDAVKRALAREEREREERARQRELRAHFDALSERELEPKRNNWQVKRQKHKTGSHQHRRGQHCPNRMKVAPNDHFEYARQDLARSNQGPECHGRRHFDSLRLKDGEEMDRHR